MWGSILGSSSTGSRGANYSQRARASKDLSDKILNVFFSRADFKDILSLSSISACPKYIFTTSQALQSLFQKIQIDPKKGPNGEIIYAPVSQLAPGLLKDSKEGSAELLEKTKERNKMCIDVAYMYMRIFQIYGALALTVLDTDPTSYRLATVSGKTFQKSTFFGGALKTSGTSSTLWSRIIRTPFAPLASYFSEERGYIKMDDKSGGEFYIEWPTILPRVINNEMTLKSIYYTSNITKEAKIKMKYETNDEVTMYLNDEPVQEFVRRISDRWLFKYDNEYIEEPSEFYKRVHDFFETVAEKTNSSKGRATSSTSSTSSTISTISTSSLSGKSAFPAFESIKKIYQEKFEGKEFPKAYCIARALTLLNPIFDEERTSGRFVQSQICKKTYSFETKDTMPRAGKHPNANIYYQSLVALYYDSYEIIGTEIKPKKTKEGMDELQNASKDIASLYDITTKPEDFLESSVPFKPFGLCSANADRTLELSDELRTALLKNVVMPMIQFQEAHTKQVNILLSQMFDVSVDRSGVPQMSFTNALKTGGIERVNYFAEIARKLLVQYYKKSEAFYVRGVLMIQTSNQFRAI